MSKRSKKTTKVATAPIAETIHKLEEKHAVPAVYVVGKNDGQKSLIDAIKKNDIVVVHGVPGSGKTHIAIMMGIAYLLQGKYDKLVLTRPYVEAGEKMGFLPGDFSQKIAPFIQPIMDICGEALGKTVIDEFIAKGNIEVLPLAYMRGRTLKNCYVVADECQNATIAQMRMLFTRMGENAKLVVTGDTEQSDLYSRDGDKNGLEDCIDRLKTVEEIGFVEMKDEHCVRSPLVTKIDKCYRTKNRVAAMFAPKPLEPKVEWRPC